MKQDTKIAKIPASAGLLLKAIEDDHGNFYDHKVYDTTLLICQLLFGGQNVRYDDNHIIIKDRINLSLSLSWNETKIYFSSYVMPAGHVPEWEFLKAQYSFRFFGLDSIFNYLLIKRQENEFIKENEG